MLPHRAISSVLGIKNITLDATMVAFCHSTEEKLFFFDVSWKASQEKFKPIKYHGNGGIMKYPFALSLPWDFETIDK